MALVSIVTPPFDAQYAARSFTATSPNTEPIFTMAPPRHLRNSGSTARDMRNGPFTLTAITRSHSSSLIPSSVDNQDIQPPESLHRAFHCAFGVPGARHVALHGQSGAALLLNFADHLSKLFQPSSRYGHAGPFPRKRQGDRSPDSRTAAGDQRHLARKSCHGIPCPRV